MVITQVMQVASSDDLLSQCWFNVESLLTTMAQHSNITSLHLLGVQAQSHVPAIPLIDNNRKTFYISQY